MGEEGGGQREARRQKARGRKRRGEEVFVTAIANERGRRMQLRFKRRNGWRNLKPFRTAFSLLFLPKEMFGTKYTQTEVIKEENQGLFPPSPPPNTPAIPHRRGRER